MVGNVMKGLVMAGGLGLATVAAFTGCATGDRSSGQHKDDSATARRVKSDLKENPIYKFEEVSVSAYRGVVQLNGWINEPEQKQVAEQITRNTPGVVKVINNLSLKPQFQLVPEQTGTGRPGSATIEHQGEASRELQEQQRPQQ